jgi:hypothetical protein
VKRYRVDARRYYDKKPELFEVRYKELIRQKKYIDCLKDKDYKRTMRKKIAAQVKAKTGIEGLRRWRKLLEDKPTSGGSAC